jgi:hypothetical protein
MRILALRRFNGGTDVIMSELHALIKQFRRYASEELTVNFDASSTWGADLANALRMLRSRDDNIFFYGLEMRGNPQTSALTRGSGCSRMVDVYWRNLELCIRNGLQLPYDEELRGELIFSEWRSDTEGGARLISKREYRKQLGRSPDSADALAFSLWEGRIIPASNAAAEYRDSVEKAEPLPPDAFPRAPMGADPIGMAEQMVRSGGGPWGYWDAMGRGDRRDD